MVRKFAGYLLILVLVALFVAAIATDTPKDEPSLADEIGTGPYLLIASMLSGALVLQMLIGWAWLNGERPDKLWLQGVYIGLALLLYVTTKHYVTPDDEPLKTWEYTVKVAMYGSYFLVVADTLLWGAGKLFREAQKRKRGE